MKKNLEYKLKCLNKDWQKMALFDFIRRMFIYYDPMELIVMGAPEDEYDSYIPNIYSMISNNNITQEKLFQSIYEIFCSECDQKQLKRKSFRMAEDLLELKKDI